MKKHWLRGLLLGVSLALLLAGGVALAQQVVSVEPWCGVCCESDDLMECVDSIGKYWTVTTSGWEPFESVLISLSPLAPSEFEVGFGGATDAEGYFDSYLILFCEPTGDVTARANYAGFGGFWSELGAYGEWEVRVTDESGEAVTHFYFAKDISECEVEEFVPEPGSLMLLGSGLAGLAGYATLRLSSRRTLR